MSKNLHLEENYEIHSSVVYDNDTVLQIIFDVGINGLFLLFYIEKSCCWSLKGVIKNVNRKCVLAATKS